MGVSCRRARGLVREAEAVPSGFQVYSHDACKGEDCFKGKGVLWARIKLNPATPETNACERQHAGGGLPGALGAGPACDQPPSGDEYVDVFDTHLNATHPELCSDSTTRNLILANIAAYVLPLPPASDLAKIIFAYLAYMEEHDLNCSVSDREIHERQLDEMNAFIQKHASPDRPSIIMGDFNIDGKALGDKDSEYREILKRLHIGPENPGALPFVNQNNYLDADDLENPFPFEYNWDIDHGDVARQFWVSSGQPYPGDGKCMGTFVGHDPLTATSGCSSMADNADGELRYDYIFVRPPIQSDDPHFTAADWVVEKHSNVSLWRSPYPGSPPVGNQFSGPPDRLSDHKPVFSALAFAKLLVYPRFHPDWKHNVEFRVLSADAANRGDASGPVDPKVANWGGHVPLGGGQGVIDKHGDWSHICQDQASVSWPADGCMDNWNWPNVMHDGNESAQFYASDLWDDDNTSADDHLPLKNHDTEPIMAITWTQPAWLGIVGWQNNEDIGVQPVVLHDTAPVALSTITTAYSGPTCQTLLFTAVELPPDQQF